MKKGKYRVTILVGFPGKPDIHRKVQIDVSALSDKAALESALEQLRSEDKDHIWNDIKKSTVEPMPDSDGEHDNRA